MAARAPLLAYEERRISRKKVLTSWSRVFASGGYRAPVREYRPAIECVVVTAAGAQFEMGHVEARDFVVSKDSVDAASGDAEPLFKHYHAHTGGARPAYAHVAKGGQYHGDALPLPMDGKPTFTRVSGMMSPSQVFLDRAAVLTSYIEDLTLVMAAFSDAVRRVNEPQSRGTGARSGGGEGVGASSGGDGDGDAGAGTGAGAGDESASRDAGVRVRRGWLKGTAIGMGFFAQMGGGVGSIAHHLMPLMLHAWHTVLTSHDWSPWIAVLELPDFSGGGQYTPAWGDSPVNGVRIVKGSSKRRDVFLFTPDEARDYVPGALNAGDCYCIPGNEFGYASVEAAMGNNSDIRVVQNYQHNPCLLDAARHVPVMFNGGARRGGGGASTGAGAGSGDGAGAADTKADESAAESAAGVEWVRVGEPALEAAAESVARYAGGADAGGASAL